MRFSLPRRFVLVSVLCVLAFAAFACGEDTSLEELGGEVQATLMARATFAAENFTPPPSATPEPEVFADLRALVFHALDIDSFFNFLQIRLTANDPLTIGSIGDEDGQLEEGWIEDCCERQWSAAQEMSDDTEAMLADVQAVYAEEDSTEHLALVSTAQGQLDEARETLDALPAALSVDEAAFIAAGGRPIVARLEQTFRELLACCEPTPVPATGEPSQ